MDEEAVDTVADTVAVSFLYLPEQLVQGLLLASLTRRSTVDVPPTCGQKTGGRRRQNRENAALR